MAAGTTLSEKPSARPSDSDGLAAKVVKYDHYIESQLHRTRRQVKNVDIASSLMLLAVASLAYLMLIALIDHWVVAGGLGFTGRFFAFALLAVGVLAFMVLRVLPLVLRRVNPIYAAHTIESHRPGIKNGLINFLLLRSGSEQLPDRVYEAMEVQAVNALTATNTEVAVDRTPVIRLLLTMVVVLIGMALYAVLSPKNLFTSVRRVISPWADVAPPTRVTIDDIQPKDGSGFHDAHVMVSAQIGGLRTGEAVTARYSTRDGQVMGKSVPMALAENAYRHTAELPPDNLGLQQDLEYWIEAGDAISPHYRIHVDTAPTIVVEEIEYHYPEYSALPSRKVARHGDIQGLAGTRVTLRAKANQPISQAHVDFGCDGRNDLPMRLDGTRAEISFALGWNEKTKHAEHENYQLRFRNEEGHENPKPIRYSIEVIPDLPPEVELVEPELDPAKELTVAAAKSVRFAVEAADPDFKLASVEFHARRRGAPQVDDSLLAEARAGEFRRDYLLDLKRLGAGPGEEVEFWATAKDNRAPQANQAETPHYRLRIATPDDKNQKPDQQNAEDKNDQRQKGGSSDEKQPQNPRGDNDQQGNEGQQGEQKSQDKPSRGKQRQSDKQDRQPDDEGENAGQERSSQGGKSQQKGGKNSNNKSSNSGSSDEQQDSGQGDQPSGEGQSKQQKPGAQNNGGGKSEDSKRLDPQRDAGKAIEEINKHFNQKEQSQGKQQDGQQPNQQQDKQQARDPSDQQDGQKQAGQQQAGEESDNASREQSPQRTQPKQGKKSEQGDAKQEARSAREGGVNSGNEKDAQAGGSEKQSPEKRPEGKDASSPQHQGKQGGRKQSSKEPKGQSGENQQADKGQDDKAPRAEKKQQQKPGAGEQGGGDEAQQAKGDEPQDKQVGKSGKQSSSGEKGAEGDEQGTPNEGGDKTMKDESGGGKQGEAKVGDEGAKHADEEARPRKGQGGQAKGAGEADDKMKKHEGESPDQKGGDPDSKDKGEGGAGDSEGANKHGAPTTHGGNQGREKKQISPDPKKGTSEDEPESSSEVKRQSDSQGAEQGDRDGGGKSGGGQRSNSEGTGSAGQNSEADQGGGKGQTAGKGATGSKGGNQLKGDKPSGGESSGEKGPGTNQGKGSNSDAGLKADSPDAADPRGHNNASRQPTQPKGEKQPNQKQPAGDSNQQKPPPGAPRADAPQEGPQGQPSPSDRGGLDVRGGNQRGNPTEGGQPGPDQTSPPPAPPDDSEPGGEQANQDYARKATELALARLKDQLAKDKPDPELLKKLNWSEEDLRRFHQQWERLRQAADETGPKGDAARQEFDDALRSLGLRPRGASLSGQKRDDRQHNLREDRRAAPPPEYEEQWREFNKATAKSRKR